VIYKVFCDVQLALLVSKFFCAKDIYQMGSIIAFFNVYWCMYCCICVSSG